MSPHRQSSRLHRILLSSAGQVNSELAQNKLTLPVMTIGAPEFFGANVRAEMLMVAENVQRSAIFEEYGHSLALEAEVRLADMLIDFMLGGT